jgi:hypothetical protein
MKESNRDNLILDLIRYAGMTPDQAVNFVLEFPIDAENFRDKILNEIRKFNKGRSVKIKIVKDYEIRNNPKDK